MALSEAQKRASKKYHDKHVEYYRMKSNESAKRIRKERHEYKGRCERAIIYLKECYSQPDGIENFMTESEMNYLLNILLGGDEGE